MKISQSLVPTLRQAPADAEVVSHKLLMRAGMIRKVAAGIYEYLPLGLISLKKVENIVRDELNKAGCQEVFLPHLIPAELWQESGRWQKYGDELLRIKDRHQRDYCFGPTHEEVICDMVRHTVSSYKSFPMNLYQIQNKFRDEIRPRFGLMRGREFLMKDGYSFHTSVEDLDREYVNMLETYHKIFKRCGLEARTVEADTGAIGGSSSHEVMVMAQTGEDMIATCSSCEYAANLEKACFHFDDSHVSYTSESPQEVHTPNLKSIEEVSRFLKTKPSQMIKTLVYQADENFVVVCLAGHREVNETKLKNVLSCDQLCLASDEDVLRLTGVPVGFLGPIGMKRTDESCHFLYDRSVLLIEEAVTGSNKKDYHTRHVNYLRDIQLNSSDKVVDVSSVLEGDSCPKCKKGTLKLLRGIEVGHIFKLGKRYSEPMKVKYLDKEGKEQTAIMGTYGIGVSRTLAACVEQNHDDKGIYWPRALAPYEVYLMNLDQDDAILHSTIQLYEGLRQKNVTVLWDDRDERAGVKFNDADLIGLPLQVIVGKRGLEKGNIEYKIRRSGEKGSLSFPDGIPGIMEVLNKL